MSEHEVKDSQKTVVAFIAGLLVGGLLVWIFSDTPAQAPTDVADTETADESADMDNTNDEDEDTDTDNNDSEPNEEPAPTMEVGEASVSLGDVTAGSVVVLESATFPTDAGWIAVRTYRDGQLGNILGASEYNRADGLTPDAIRLLAPTVAGREYAVVFFSQDGNPAFNLEGDVQLDTELTTFTAQ